MPQPEVAPEAAVERLKRDIASDRARLAFAMQMAQTVEMEEDLRVGRLYKVFEAMGQAQ